MFGPADKSVDGYNGMISMLFLKCFLFCAKSEGNHEKNINKIKVIKSLIFNRASVKRLKIKGYLWRVLSFN